MTVLSENPVVLSENSCAGRVVRELECAHFRDRIPTSRFIPGAGSAARARCSHAGSRSETNVDHLLLTAEQASTRRPSPARRGGARYAVAMAGVATRAAHLAGSALTHHRAVTYLLWPGSGVATGESDALVAVGEAVRSRLWFNRSIASTRAGMVTS